MPDDDNERSNEAHRKHAVYGFLSTHNFIYLWIHTDVSWKWKMYIIRGFLNSFLNDRIIWKFIMGMAKKYFFNEMFRPQINVDKKKADFISNFDVYNLVY